MKRLLSVLLVAVGLIAVVAPIERQAEAQVYPATFCCDQYDVKRCIIPPGPTGYACYCNGVPGAGLSCW